jgi:DnaJ-class molecular chaperone
MARNYYVVLGVPWDAAPETIRSAFRRLARRYHPDRGDAANARAFREAAEAYDVLSDPGRRARYDRQFERVPREATRTAEHVRRPEPEPLISEPVSVTGRAEEIRPSVDALLDRFARNFSAVDLPKAEHQEPLDFELILSREESECGVRVPFRIPVFRPCRRCGGTGSEWFDRCPACAGEGRAVDHAALHIDIPPGVRDRTRFDVSLARFGVRNLWLRLHIRVERR